MNRPSLGFERSATTVSAAALVLFAVTAAISAGSAGAQGQGSTASSLSLEEVTVTARRREENLQDVPLTVTAFTAKSIERLGIRNVQDVARLTPGLSFDKGFAPQDTRPSIRGLPTTRGRPPIGILLDGIDISSESISTAGGSSLMNLKLVDVERIEVVKGQPVAGADLELDLLRRLLTHEELVLLLDVVDDRVVHLVTADAQ